MADSDSTFFEVDDVANRENVDKDIEENLREASWPIQLKVALACRKLAAEGHAETLAGQVTVKAENETFWSNQIQGGFSNATQGSVLRFDNEMEVVEGTGIPNMGVRFHLWVYRARPDINAIVHTHPPHAAALSMTGKELKIAHMDSTMFFDDCAHLKEWPGVPVANEEGRIISEALGDKSTILLANHGYLTVGKTLEEATYLAVQFERAARLQIMAESIGDIQAIEDHHAQDAHDFLLRDGVVFGTFNAWAEELLRDHPEIAS